MASKGQENHEIDNIPLCLQLINKEEELLGKEKSTFPLLQTVMTNKVPYEQLWTTTYEFSIKSEEWMNGKPQVPCAGQDGDGVMGPT